MASTAVPITLVSMGEWLFRAEERLLERQEGSTSSRALQFTQHRAECRGTSLLIRHTSFFPPNIFSSPFPIGVTFSAAKSHCFCPFTAFPRFICGRGVPKAPQGYCWASLPRNAVGGWLQWSGWQRKAQAEENPPLEKADGHKHVNSPLWASAISVGPAQVRQPLQPAGCSEKRLHPSTARQRGNPSCSFPSMGAQISQKYLKAHGLITYRLSHPNKPVPKLSTIPQDQDLWWFPCENNRMDLYREILPL